MTDELRDVVGVGNAIVDALSRKDDAFLHRFDLAKGAMTLVGPERAEQLYALMGDVVLCSGGSAANTVVGVSSLGGRASYIGKVKDDAVGRVFRDDIRAAGVRYETPPATTGPATARCMIFVTPDAQRTMQTFLGASATLGPDDIDADVIGGARITFLEGYLWDPEQAKRAFMKAADLAHARGRKVALTLSDPFCVERHRQEFLELVHGHVDILLANENELVALFEGISLDRAIEALRGACEVAAVTRGPRGSIIVAGTERVRVAAEPVAAVIDTTGAGDLYAAGFLYGLSRGRDLATCGRLGSIAAAEVISHFGARPETPLADLAAGL